MLPEEDVGKGSQNLAIIREFIQDKFEFVFSFRPAALPGQQSSTPTVSFQVFGCVRQALLDDSKSIFKMMILNIIANS